MVSSACGESSSIVKLNHSGSGNIGASAILRDEYSCGRQENISVITIDDFCANFGLLPKLIKMDVEGWEYFALKGARRTLSSVRPMVVLELSPAFLRQNGSSAEALVELMASEGYAPWRISAESGKLDLLPLVLADIRHQVEVLFVPSARASS